MYKVIPQATIMLTLSTIFGVSEIFMYKVLPQAAIMLTLSTIFG